MDKKYFIESIEEVKEGAYRALDEGYVYHTCNGIYEFLGEDGKIEYAKYLSLMKFNQYDSINHSLFFLSWSECSDSQKKLVTIYRIMILEAFKLDMIESGKYKEIGNDYE